MPRENPLNDPAWTETKLGAVIDSAPDAILVSDSDGVITLANAEAHRMFGYERGELVGRSIEILVPERFKPEHSRHRERYVQDPRVRPMGIGVTLYGKRSDGTEFPAEIGLSPLRGGDGLQVIAVVRDVTEREAAREKRKRTTRELDPGRVLNTLLGNVPGFAYRCANDPDWTMHFISGGCLRLTGYLPIDFTEGRVSYGGDVIHPDDRDRVWEQVQEAVAKRVPFELEYRIRSSDGETRWVWERGVAVFESAGEEPVLEGFVSDVSGRRRAEQERERMKRLANERERMADLGALVGKVAHDFGNALAGLTMQAQLIQRRAEQGRPIDSVLEASQILVSETARLREIISELREIAREPVLTLSEVDIPPLLERTRQLWLPVAEELRATLRVEIDDGATDLRIRADEGKVRRVLDNLVRNALDALGGEPGDVVLRCACDEASRHAILTVEDTGTGVPEGIDVFRMFETTKEQGTGLGLSVCKQIVVSHGGDIRYERLDPKGTAFVVELPLGGIDEGGEG